MSATRSRRRSKTSQDPLPKLVVNLRRPANVACATNLKTSSNRNSILHCLCCSASGRGEKRVSTIANLNDSAKWRYPILPRITPHDLPINDATLGRRLDQFICNLRKSRNLGRQLENFRHVDMLAPRFHPGAHVLCEIVSYSICVKQLRGACLVHQKPADNVRESLYSERCVLSANPQYQPVPVLVIWVITLREILYAPSPHLDIRPPTL